VDEPRTSRGFSLLETVFLAISCGRFVNRVEDRVALGDRTGFAIELSSRPEKFVQLLARPRLKIYAVFPYFSTFPVCLLLLLVLLVFNLV
jgi:hypothetical protein